MSLNNTNLTLTEICEALSAEYMEKVSGELGHTCTPMEAIFHYTVNVVNKEIKEEDTPSLF
jgi:hypothetical protein